MSAPPRTMLRPSTATSCATLRPAQAEMLLIIRLVSSIVGICYMMTTPLRISDGLEATEGGLPTQSVTGKE